MKAPSFREIPPVCLVIALVRLALGRLRMLSPFKGTSVKMSDGSMYTIFRDIAFQGNTNDHENCVFVVHFRFSRLSQKANRLVSLVPMMLIAGFPGFMRKMYAVNPVNGNWQGMYQWKSDLHLQRYKRSFVFRMMNRRAIPGSVSAFEIQGGQLTEFVQEHRAMTQEEGLR